MKLFIKILLFVLVALITNVEVVSASITFPNIQETTTSFSFHKEKQKVVFKVIENDLANCCQNGQDLVDYRSWGINIIGNAAKGGFSSFNAFKKAYGSAGKGNAWHQIVEQGGKQRK